MISHGWVNCLNPHYHALDPLQYAWRVENGTLEPHWYEGSALPSKEELDNYNDAQLEEFSVDEFSVDDVDTGGIDGDDNDSSDNDDASVCLSDLELDSDVADEW